VCGLSLDITSNIVRGASWVAGETRPEEYTRPQYGLTGEGDNGNSDCRRALAVFVGFELQDAPTHKEQ